MQFVWGQQAEGGVFPSTLLISTQVASSSNAAMPDHGCFEMPLACAPAQNLCVLPNMKLPMLTRPWNQGHWQAPVMSTVATVYCSGSLRVTVKLRWAVPITPAHPPRGPVTSGV